MNWLVFVVFAFIALAVDLSLGVVVTLQSVGGLTPSATIVLVAFIALFAPRAPALWSAWTLGVLLDLTAPRLIGPLGAITLIGPHALGAVAAALLVLWIRPMLLKRRVLTFAVTTALAGAAIGLVVVFLLSVRMWLPGEDVFAGDHRPLLELLRRLGCAIYTGFLALLLGPLLLATHGAWGFRSEAQRTASWR